MDHSIGGSPGQEDPPVSNRKVVIHEILARPGSGTPFDWKIELFNSSSPTLALDGWYLSDDSSFPFQARLADNLTIGSNAFLVITSSNVTADQVILSTLVKPSGGKLSLFSADSNSGLTGHEYHLDYGPMARLQTMGWHIEEGVK